MSTPDYAKAQIVASAALGALTRARQLSIGLLPTPAEGGPAILRGHAAEMARSPLGRDQVLSLALLAAADDLEGERLLPPPREQLLPDLGPNDDSRLAIRTRVLKLGPIPTAGARDAASELERRYGPECVSDRALSARLTAEANLHELLWDDPRLPATDRIRLTMLFSVPHLVARAEALQQKRRPLQAQPQSVPVGRPGARLRQALGLRLTGGVLAVGSAIAVVGSFPAGV